jgi:hypothetical protein
MKKSSNYKWFPFFFVQAFILITFLALSPIAKADYTWNGNLTLGSDFPRKLTGSVGSITITIQERTQAEGKRPGADGSIIREPIEMFQHTDFPSNTNGGLTNFGITNVTTFREDDGQRYKLTFSQPVDYPLVAISSLGNPSTQNTFTLDSINDGTPGTVNILWQQKSSSGFTTSTGTETTSPLYNLNASVPVMTNVTYYTAGEGDFILQVREILFLG